MEPISASLTTAKEVYEAVKTIEKVYDVSKEMKSVAETEGKDQIEATKKLGSTVAKELAGASGEVGNDGKTEKDGAKPSDVGTKGEVNNEQSESPSQKGVFVDRLKPKPEEGSASATSPVEFVEKLPSEEKYRPIQNEPNVFVDKVSSNEGLKDYNVIESNDEVINSEEMKSEGQLSSSDEKDIVKEEHNSDISEVGETKKVGGSYGELKREGWGWNSEPPKEIHHIPSNESSHLETNEGPAIVMDYEDHRQTASCGRSKEAQEYRAKQKELIEQGKFREAMQMDIDDIHEKFGTKYDKEINQMLEYYKELETKKKV